MAYEIGTATDYKDLLAKLKTFVTTNAALVAAGQQWTVMRHTAPASGDHELILRGPGLAGVDQIYVGIKTEDAPAISGYNWKLQGFTAFANVTFDAQPGAMGGTNQPRLLLVNSPMNYWFVASGRRIIVVARAGSTYQIAYLGLIMPYGPPKNLPYPLFIGGCCYESSVWNRTTWEHSPFFYPRHPTGGVQPTVSQGYFLGSSGWRPVTFKAGGSYYYTELCVMPYSLKGYAQYLCRNLFQLRPNRDGSYPLLPVLLCAQGTSRNIYGEFEGMWALPGFGLVSEDSIVGNGANHIVFSGGPLTDVDNFVAIRME